MLTAVVIAHIDTKLLLAQSVQCVIPCESHESIADEVTTRARVVRRCVDTVELDLTALGLNLALCTALIQCSDVKVLQKRQMETCHLTSLMQFLGLGLG